MQLLLSLVEVETIYNRDGKIVHQVLSKPNFHRREQYYYYSNSYSVTKMITLKKHVKIYISKTLAIILKRCRSVHKQREIKLHQMRYKCIMFSKPECMTFLSLSLLSAKW